MVIRQKKILARSNWKRRQAGTKFNGFLEGEGGKEERNQESVSHGSPLISASARCSHSVSKIRPILPRPKQNKALALVVRRSLLEAKFPLTSHSAERSRKDVMLWNL